MRISTLAEPCARVRKSRGFALGRQFLALPLLRFLPEIFLAHGVAGLFDDAEKIENGAKDQGRDGDEQNEQRCYNEQCERGFCRLQNDHWKPAGGFALFSICCGSCAFRG